MLRTGKIFLAVLMGICSWQNEIPAQRMAFIDPREAEDAYSRKNYNEAAEVYKKLIDQHPDKISYRYKAGLCYLNCNIGKEQAIPYFEWITVQPKAPADAWYQLGVAYHYASRFEDAIDAFTMYEKAAKGADLKRAERQITECQTGIELTKHPLNVTITNLGDNVNSDYADYYPLVSADGKTLVFTSRRPGLHSRSVEMDGFYSSDIYISHFVNGSWQKAVSISEEINTSKDEEAVGLTPDASQLVVYVDNVKNDGKIYYSSRRGKSYGKPVDFPQAVNDGFQSSGCFSADGKIIFFASERAGGYGGRDIYMLRKLPDGKWGGAQNLGSNINTPDNEDFPWFDNDSGSLYFSSQGHSTMGSYDLFESQWICRDSNNWSPVRNLGYPINTPGDDRSISFTKDHKTAFVTRSEADSRGDLDIYQISFNDVTRFALISGTISTFPKTKNIDARITVTNRRTQEQFYFKPVKKSGRYVMALVPGTYDVQIEAKGYQSIYDVIKIADVSKSQFQQSRNYQLLPQTTLLGSNQEKGKLMLSYH